jgi:hypothetical protein
MLLETGDSALLTLRIAASATEPIGQREGSIVISSLETSSQMSYRLMSVSLACWYRPVLTHWTGMSCKQRTVTVLRKIDEAISRETSGANDLSLT